MCGRLREQHGLSLVMMHEEYAPEREGAVDYVLRILWVTVTKLTSNTKPCWPIQSSPLLLFKSVVQLPNTDAQKGCVHSHGGNLASRKDKEGTFGIT